MFAAPTNGERRLELQDWELEHSLLIHYLLALIKGYRLERYGGPDVDDTGRLIRLARKYDCPAVERSCEGLLNEHLCQDPKNAVNVFQVAAAIGFVSICKSVVRSFDIERSWTENEKLYAVGEAYKVGHKKGALAVLAHWSFADLSQTPPEYIWALLQVSTMEGTWSLRAEKFHEFLLECQSWCRSSAELVTDR